MTKEQTKVNRINGAAAQNLMNQKSNWKRETNEEIGVNPAFRGIPVKFEPKTAGFDVDIKKAVTVNIGFETEAPLVPGLFNLNSRMGGSEAMARLSLFKVGPAMTRATLPETMLDERRLEAVLKAVPKKR